MWVVVRVPYEDLGDSGLTSHSAVEAHTHLQLDLPALDLEWGGRQGINEINCFSVRR